MSLATRRALARAWELASADPSKRYPAAASARQMLEHARESVATALSCESAAIAFLSGSADDAMALAMRAAVTKRSRATRSGTPIRLVVSAVEEIGVLRAADNLVSAPPTGASVDLHRVPVDRFGAVLAEELLELASQEPSVVVLQAANGELGTRQPLGPIAEALPDGTPLVVDGRHCIGRCPLALPADFLIAEPKAWGGPPGISLIAASHPTGLAGIPAPTDGPWGVEPSNPPVPLIAAAAVSLEMVAKTMREDMATSTQRTDQMRAMVLNQIPDALVLGHPRSRLGYVSMFSFLYVAADELVDELARSGWAVASGSACTSDTHRPLHVLTAIDALTHGNLRVSLPPWTTEDTVSLFVSELSRIVAKIRSDSGVSDL
jgi:cysteine desulfurase